MTNQDILNLFIDFLLEAKVGKKYIFRDAINQEDYVELLTLIARDPRITEKVIGDAIGSSDYATIRIISKCLYSDDFLYYFFQQLNQNYFELLSKCTFKSPHFSDALSINGFNKEVIIPKNVDIKVVPTFFNCAHLESIIINAPITELTYEQFEYCDELRKLTLPCSVKEIDGTAINYRDFDPANLEIIITGLKPGEEWNPIIDVVSTAKRDFWKNYKRG